MLVCPAVAFLEVGPVQFEDLRARLAPVLAAGSCLLGR